MGPSVQGQEVTQEGQTAKKEVTVYRGTSTGNKSDKDGVAYYTPNRDYAAFYDSGKEKSNNTALQELEDLKEPAKPLTQEPISDNELVDLVQSLGYNFNSVSDIKNRIDELNSIDSDKITVEERNELQDLGSEYDNYDTKKVEQKNNQALTRYEKELSDYNKKKFELESKSKNYLSPKKLSGNFFNLGIDFSEMSPEKIFEKLKSLGISNKFKGGNFLDNYHSDLVDFAKKNNIDFFDGIIGGIQGSMNTKPEEIIEVSKLSPEAQEGVALNKEPFTEDVAPEQKAKVEEQNRQDEEEAVTEIYDFNDEIKSIGTKEQFKAFLKTLVPQGVFSRIAWHNTSKPELTPREKQYYTNTRKNAEDTYKQENTFPAIIFGNNPKKATFDEVQDVDTEAVKSGGNDIVITDDLSPAIGADMNYREFVTTNAEQVIPLATKENIDAFKAFVEQQKETTTPQATPQVTPQAQEVEKEPTEQEQAKMEEEVAKEEVNRAKVREYNKNAKENRGENIKVKDFKTVKKRGQNLKVGDVYSRRIGDAVYVFKVLSDLRKTYGQFYAMDVEVLNTGTDYVRQELQVDFEIKEVGKKVGEKSIDLFKNLSSSSGGFNFGEVTVLQDYEAKTKKESNVEEVKETPSETVQAQEIEQEVAETAEFTEEETQSAIKEYEDIMSKPGIDKLDAKREFIEKYGALGERVVDIDSNFDNILDKLGAIKTCTIEIIRK